MIELNKNKDGFAQATELLIKFFKKHLKKHNDIEELLRSRNAENELIENNLIKP
jgi:hypothetical protein